MFEQHGKSPAAQMLVLLVVDDLLRRMKDEKCESNEAYFEEVAKKCLANEAG